MGIFRKLKKCVLFLLSAVILFSAQGAAKALITPEEFSHLIGLCRSEMCGISRVAASKMFIKKETLTDKELVALFKKTEATIKRKTDDYTKARKLDYEVIINNYYDIKIERYTNVIEYINQKFGRSYNQQELAWLNRILSEYVFLKLEILEEIKAFIKEEINKHLTEFDKAWSQIDELFWESTGVEPTTPANVTPEEIAI